MDCTFITWRDTVVDLRFIECIKPFRCACGTGRLLRIDSAQVSEPTEYKIWVRYYLSQK